MDEAKNKLKNITIEGNNVLLTNGEETHKIGELHEKTIVMLRDPDKHIMRKWNAYGIVAELVDSELIDEFIFDEGGTYLSISRNGILAHGRYYREEGHEPQYFVNRELMEKLT